MDASTRLHGSLMACIEQGNQRLPDEYGAAVTRAATAILHLESYLGAREYREMIRRSFEPLGMIGLWYVCEDGIAHNLSQRNEDDSFQMACLEAHRPMETVTEVAGQDFCDDCRNMAALPGEDGDAENQALLDIATETYAPE